MRTVPTKRYLIFGDFVEVSTRTEAQNRCGLLAYQMTMTYARKIGVKEFDELYLSALTSCLQRYVSQKVTGV